MDMKNQIANYMFLGLVGVLIVGGVVVYVAVFKPNDKVLGTNTEVTSVINVNGNNTEVSFYKSSKFSVDFSYPAVFGKSVTTMIPKGGCEKGDKEIVSLGKQNEINVNINSCISLNLNGVEENYTLKSKNGTEFSVSVYTDSSDKKINHIYAEGGKVYITAEPNQTINLEMMKQDLSVIISGMNVSL